MVGRMGRPLRGHLYRLTIEKECGRQTHERQ